MITVSPQIGEFLIKVTQLPDIEAALKRVLTEYLDINSFLNELLHELSQLDFIDRVDFHLEIITIKDRVFLKKELYFLEIYYNEQTGTTAFALIENRKRIWGIDYDNVREWHEHPIENPEIHKAITS